MSFGGGGGSMPAPAPVQTGPTAEELAAQKKAEQEAARAARNRMGRRKTILTGEFGDQTTPELSGGTILTGDLKDKLGA